MGLLSFIPGAGPFLDGAASVASSAGKFLAPFAPYIALAAVGFAGGVGYEHRGDTWIVGAGPFKRLSNLQASLPARDRSQRDIGAKAQFAVDAPVFAKFQSDLTTCRTGRSDDATTAARELSAARSSSSLALSAAYKMGRATCGASNVSSSSPGAPGALAIGGLRIGESGADFRNLFGAGSFTVPGGGPVSAGGTQPPKE